MIIYLSSNERKFLELLCQGMRPSQIAKAMGKSPRTVDGYRDELFRLTGAQSQAGLVAWSFNNRLVKPKKIARLHTRSSQRGAKSFKEQTLQLQKDNRRYSKALKTIIQALQCVKEDLICGDIIRISEKALKIK